MGSPKPMIVIRPTSGWRAINLGELWLYRDLFWALGVRDVKLRYRQTALGAIWVLLQPLLAAGIFSFVFGRVAGLSSEGPSYFVFAYIGLLGWNAFSETVNKASMSLVANRGMVGKIFFPRLVLPCSSALSTVIDFAVSTCVLIVLLLANDVALRPQLLLLPLWLLLMLMLSLGLGLVAAAYNVTYRDVAYVVPVAVQMVLYASPVAYSVAAVPRGARSVFVLNPLVGVLEGFRWSALGGRLEVVYVLWSILAAVVVLLGGAIVFRGKEKRFADVI